MSAETVIAGITLVDDKEHKVCGLYPSRAEDNDSLLVIEIPNARLLHTRVEGGHPEGRIAVFGRYITDSEYELRLASFDEDPEVYHSNHIKSLSN